MSQKPVSPLSSRRGHDPLAKFPEEIRAAYARFGTTRDPQDLDAVVLAVVRDYIPKKEGVAEKPVFTESARLIDDLGFDSLAITETVFFFEDLFKVRITNSEIMQVHTVGQLRAFLRSKLAQNFGRSA